MRRKQGNDQTARVIDTLKGLFRARGMRHAEIADALGLSRSTLKRRLAGSGLTIPFLESLCGLIGVNLIELFELAVANRDTRSRRLTLEQEKALHADVRLGFIFSRLQLGWSAEEVQRECGISEAPLILYLMHLENLGLIDLLPGNRVRLHTAREIDWRKHGPMWHSVDRYLKDIFTMTDSDDEELSRRTAVVKLSQASIGQLDQLFYHVQTEVRRLAQIDRMLVPDEKTWYAVLVGARPFEVDLGADMELPWCRRGQSAARKAEAASQEGSKREPVPARAGIGRQKA